MMVELIGEVYDTPRVVRIVGADESQKVVKINQFFQEAGKPKQFRVSAGKYDVVCTAGPSFQTKRQEASNLLVGLAGKVPILMQAAPDLIMKAIDVPYGQEIAERLKKLLPPQLQDNPEGQPEIPPQVQQKMTQMGEMMDHLTKELNAKNQLIESKQLELDSRERIEMAKIEAQIAIAEIDTKAQSAIERTQMFKDIWKQLHTTSADAAMQDQQHTHEAAMASAQGSTDMQQQQQQQQQQQATSQQQQQQQEADAQQSQNRSGGVQ
jgi:hypothetical protein